MNAITATEVAALIEPSASTLYEQWSTFAAEVASAQAALRRATELSALTRPALAEADVVELAQAAAQAAKTTEAQTWILSLSIRYYDPAYCGGAWRMRDTVHVVHQVEPLEPGEFMEVGDSLLRHQAFPASRFHEMNGSTRSLYEPQYRAYVVFRAAVDGRELGWMGGGPQAADWVKAGS